MAQVPFKKIFARCDIDGVVQIGSMTTSQERFLSALATSMHCAADIHKHPGVTVAGTSRRAGSHVTAGYQLGQHFVITCDPPVEQMLTTAAADMAPTMDAWQQVAISSGGELVGSSCMQLLRSASLPSLPLNAGYSLRSLSRDEPGDVAMIERLVEASGEDDLDEAEIELDNLDPIIEVIVGADEEIVTYSGGLPFELAPAFADIGVLTRPNHRGNGLGTAAVAALCPRLTAAGVEPLYRFADDNVASRAVAAAVGFELVTHLVAYRFPA